jgi:hypothetical protein
MTKNKKSILIGGLLFALVVTVLAGVGVSNVFAQSPTQNPSLNPSQGFGHGHGPGGGLSLTGLQIAAQKLGMTTDALITELQSGKTLEQIAQEKGVDYTSIQAAIQQQSQADMRTRIQQAVTDGTISQAKADWLLEGLDKGYIGGADGDGFLGGPHGFGLGPNKAPQGQSTTPTQPAPTQQSSS